MSRINLQNASGHAMFPAVFPVSTAAPLRGTGHQNREVSKEGFSRFETQKDGSAPLH